MAFAGLLLSEVLPYLVCGLIAASATLIWRQSLTAPWSFCGVAFLLSLGLAEVILWAVSLIKVVGGGPIFLQMAKPRAVEELADSGITAEAGIVSALVVLLGVPLLIWIKGELR